MSDYGLLNQRSIRSAYAYATPSEGHFAVGLGVVAVLTGLAAALGGLLIGFGVPAHQIHLPAGLGATSPENLAIVTTVCGVVTMLFGATSIYRSREM